MAFFQRANLRIEKNSEESAVLLLDVAGRSVNVFNREVFADLDEVGIVTRLFPSKARQENGVTSNRDGATSVRKVRCIRATQLIDQFFRSRPIAINQIEVDAERENSNIISRRWRKRCDR